VIHVLFIYIYGVTPAGLVLQAKRTIRNTHKRDVLDMRIWFSLILNIFSRLLRTYSVRYEQAIDAGR
jgi:hypothetical protein